MSPILKMKEWLTQENELTSACSDRVVLATASKKGVPRSRVVAIREMSEEGILFFTQRGSKKVQELKENPLASMTLWLPQQQREVICEGSIYTLTTEENHYYWTSLPKERQVRFATYAPTSGQTINSLAELENKHQSLLNHYTEKTVPLCEYYCGFRLIPHTFCFYTLGTETFSEIIRYTQLSNGWQKHLLSP